MNNTFKFRSLYIIINWSIKGLIIFLTTSLGIINAQNTLKWGFDRDDHKVITDYVETSPGKYIFAGTIKGDDERNKSLNDSAWILKWSFDGDSISKMYKPGNVNGCIYGCIEPCKNGDLLVMGRYESSMTIDTSSFLAVYYDSLLNIKWTTQLTLPRRWVSARTAVKTLEGDWIIGLYTKNYDWFGAGINQGFLVKMSGSGEILKVVSDTISDLQQVMMHPDSTRIYCLGDYMEIPGIETDAWLKEYDLDLNFISQKPIITSFTINADRFHGKWIAEDTMLLAGYHSTTSNYWCYDLVLNKLIDGDSLISTKEQRYFYEGEDYMYENRAIAITKDRKIILTGGVGGAYEEKGFIGRYNMNLDPLNYWIFDDDPYYYFLYNNPKPTADSGFIVTLIKKSDINSDSIFTIKFDKEGPFVRIDNPSGYKQTNHLLYPNPGKNMVSLELAKPIRQKGEVTFELYTLQGIKAGQWHTRETRTLINTTNQPPGVYLYRITRQGKQLASGKWVKQ